MMVDERSAGVIAPFQHIRHVFAEWRKAGTDMPFAIVLGVEPAARSSLSVDFPTHESICDVRTVKITRQEQLSQHRIRLG
jgi:UbiD family decarboxylase